MEHGPRTIGSFFTAATGDTTYEIVGESAIQPGVMKLKVQTREFGWNDPHAPVTFRASEIARNVESGIWKVGDHR